MVCVASGSGGRPLAQRRGGPPQGSRRRTPSPRRTWRASGASPRILCSMRRARRGRQKPAVRLWRDSPPCVWGPLRLEDTKCPHPLQITTMPNPLAKAAICNLWPLGLSRSPRIEGDAPGHFCLLGPPVRADAKQRVQSHLPPCQCHSWYWASPEMWALLASAAGGGGGQALLLLQYYFGCHAKEPEKGAAHSSGSSEPLRERPKGRGHRTERSNLQSLWARPAWEATCGPPWAGPLAIRQRRGTRSAATVKVARTRKSTYPVRPDWAWPWWPPRLPQCGPRAGCRSP